MSTRGPRIIGLLDGDLAQNPVVQTKFGGMVAALAARTDLVAIGNGQLRGPARLLNAATSVMYDRRLWREHFRKNPRAFRLRSRQVDGWLQGQPHNYDLIFQVGALFAPGWPQPVSPYVLYLDFTHALMAREWPQRSPMTRAERKQWLRLEQKLYAGAQTIFVRSRYVQGSLAVDYAVQADKVIVVGAGVNVSIPEPPQRSDAPHVLFIGQDRDRKGGDVLLAAWAHIRQRAPEARLTYVGTPGMAVPAGVEVLPVWSRAQVLSLLHDATIFSMPSRCETWGDVFLEAMAYGLPCIGTTADAMPEIIMHGTTGYVIPPSDVAALGDALLHLIREPELARSFGLMGRQRVLEHFTWDHVITRMIPALHAGCGIASLNL